MTHNRYILLAALLLAGCSKSGQGTPKAADGTIFAMKEQAAAPGSDVRVSLESLPTSGSIVTIVGEIDYDSTQLTMKQCEINRIIGEGTPIGKTLHVVEPAKGVIRAVIAGTLEPLPRSGEVMSCTFTVAADASPGRKAVTAKGEVADTTFEDRPFIAEGGVVVR